MTSPAVRRLLLLLYGAGILILADQAADLVATYLGNPPSPGAATWRFGAFGLAISRISVILIADVMLFAAALALDHQGVIRALGVAHLVLGVLVLGGLAVFALDWLQVRGQIRADRAQNFDFAAARALLVGLLASVVLMWAGLLAWRGTKHKKPHRGVSAVGLVGIHRDDSSQ